MRTIRTATVILTASSMFFIRALTVALAHKSRINGDSYIVLANLSSRGSGDATENSLYPCCSRSTLMSECNSPLLADVRKKFTVACVHLEVSLEDENRQTHLNRTVCKLCRRCVLRFRPLGYRRGIPSAFHRLVFVRRLPRDRIYQSRP